MNYIEYKAGLVYDPAHLRQAKSVDELLSLARQGHPLAWTHNGGEVNFIIEVRPKSYVFSCWDSLLSMWVMRPRGEKKLMKHLRFAPLAVKDDRPLHVGDWIEYRCGFALDKIKKKQIELYVGQLGHENTLTPSELEGLSQTWRWPVEVTE